MRMDENEISIIVSAKNLSLISFLRKPKNASIKIPHITGTILSVDSVISMRVFEPLKRAGISVK